MHSGKYPSTGTLTTSPPPAGPGWWLIVDTTDHSKYASTIIKIKQPILMCAYILPQPECVPSISDLIAHVSTPDAMPCDVETKSNQSKDEARKN